MVKLMIAQICFSSMPMISTIGLRSQGMLLGVGPRSRRWRWCRAQGFNLLRWPMQSHDFLLQNRSTSASWPASRCLRHPQPTVFLSMSVNHAPESMTARTRPVLDTFSSLRCPDEVHLPKLLGKQDTARVRTGCSLPQVEAPSAPNALKSSHAR